MDRNQTLLRNCGTIGLIGAVFPVFADILSWFLAEDYSPLRDSISALAVGPSSWLSDLGVQVFGGACIVVAVGMWASQIGARRWTPALLALGLVGICAFVVAEVNEKPRSTMHLTTVGVMALLFAATTLLAIPGLRTRSARLAPLSLGIGVSWIVLCAIYWFLTETWSGAVERLLAILMLVWLGSMARILRESARDRTWTAAEA